MAGNDQNLAVLLYQDLPAEQIPEGIPLDWPAEIKELGSGTTLPAPEWLLMTTSELAQYKAARQPAYDQWEDENIIHEPASEVLKKQVSNDVFASLTNSATLKINHDVELGVCAGDVIPGGVDHDLLLNNKSNQHIDHSTVRIIAGDGLIGGGDLTRDQTLSLATVHWHRTTQYLKTQLVYYTNTGATDINGRITFDLTEDASSNGIALFSSILNVSAIAVDASGIAIQGPYMIIESVTATKLIIRGIKGTSSDVLIGGTIVSSQFAGSNYSVFVSVIGVKAL